MATDATGWELESLRWVIDPVGECSVSHQHTCPSLNLATFPTDSTGEALYLGAW